MLAKQVGVKHLVVFVNKLDVADPELVDLVVLDVDELLRGFGYADVPIVKGSALGALTAVTEGRLADPWVATIDELVATLDRAIPAPVRDYAAPFLMPVESVHTITGIGTVVTGRVSRGVVRIGDNPQRLQAAAVRRCNERDRDPAGRRRACARRALRGRPRARQAGGARDRRPLRPA